VQLAVALLDVRADARGRVLLEQVGGNEADAILAQLGCERTQAILATRDEHERRARLAREAPRRGFADPAGGACDQPNHPRHPIRHACPHPPRPRRVCSLCLASTSRLSAYA
jgi:L-alanine-DL-glutamate epimerase-like enolase superfamily enzyme